jgi:hypothetical protein
MPKQNPPKPSPQSGSEPRIGKLYHATLSVSGGRILSRGKVKMTSSSAGKYFPNPSGLSGTPPSGEVQIEMPGLHAWIVLEKVCTLDVEPIHQHFQLR